VSIVFAIALVPAVVRAGLLAFVAVVALLTDDKDRRKTAMAILEVLALGRPAGPGRRLSRSDHDR
jgi:hypothetical protein